MIFLFRMSYSRYKTELSFVVAKVAQISSVLKDMFEVETKLSYLLPDSIDPQTLRLLLDWVHDHKALVDMNLVQAEPVFDLACSWNMESFFANAHRIIDISGSVGVVTARRLGHAKCEIWCACNVPRRSGDPSHYTCPISHETGCNRDGKRTHVPYNKEDFDLAWIYHPDGEQFWILSSIDLDKEGHFRSPTTKGKTDIHLPTSGHEHWTQAHLFTYLDPEVQTKVWDCLHEIQQDLCDT